MTGSAVLVTRNGGVTTLTLNRPESRNAMSLAMVDELLAALDAAAQDGETRVIVLRGAGDHFCSGGDLKDMAAARGGGVDSIAKVNRRFGELCAAVVASPLAIVAVLEGGVMGGGFGLACAADVAIPVPTSGCRKPRSVWSRRRLRHTWSNASATRRRNALPSPVGALMARRQRKLV